jgi:hypothetical protein
VHPLKNFPAFYGSKRLFTVFIKALHQTITRARLIQSVPKHLISLTSVLYNPPTYVLRLLSHFLSSGFPTNTLYGSSSPHVCYMSSPFHPHLLHDSNSSWQRGQAIKILHMQLFQPPVTSSLLSPNILNTLISNTFSLCSFLNVRDNVPQPYTTQAKLQSFIFQFLRF